LQGYDFYTVQNPEDKSMHVALCKWNREELAGQVQEECKTLPISEAIEFFEVVNEHLMTDNLLIDGQTTSPEFSEGVSWSATQV